ncbi:MAG: zinc ribbon domain-containing protein, partial [Erysipelotrichaceae bacterium]|nr:zinc ribbon domain-containing protein [Erysipelotrichaceae bacterium]
KQVLSLSERVYRCECGCTNDRDVNAAINIREEALIVYILKAYILLVAIGKSILRIL